MNQNKIIRGDTKEKEAAKSVLIMAFSSDPWMRWWWPEPQVYLKNMTLFMNEYLAISIPAKGTYVVEDGSGASVWLPPGYLVEDRVLAPAVMEIPKPRQEHAFKMFEQFHRCHPEEDHWYLPWIGVDPVQHGQGLGSSMLKEVLTLVDEQGKVAYLESSNPLNISLYERHGFKVVDRIQEGDSPPVHPMTRQPR